VEGGRAREKVMFGSHGLESIGTSWVENGTKKGSDRDGKLNCAKPSAVGKTTKGLKQKTLSRRKRHAGKTTIQNPNWSGGPLKKISKRRATWGQVKTTQ